MPLRISNRDARRLWLAAQGLSATPTGPLDLMGTIRSLGFVQLDTIRNVTRAHHHILWSRNQNYREPMLGKLLARDRRIFEHYTHDASVIPVEFYPMWRRQFDRMRDRLHRSSYYGPALDAAEQKIIRDRIENEGPLSTHAFDTKIEGAREMWARPPHKKTLDYLWYVGDLSTSHRENFIKYYDLTHRVIPEDLRAQEIAHDRQVDWLCDAALFRLTFASPGEVQRFWEATTPAEVRQWIERRSGALAEVEIQTADRQWIKALAVPDIEQKLADTPEPTSRLRIINPFDPAIRDRTRTERLFGFDYRIEIFVPAEKRLWGYYVYPLLEGDRFVGRMEIKADRNAGFICATRFWPEPRVQWSAQRRNRLEAELHRMARLIGVADVRYGDEFAID